jgi:hypothetical protein
VKHALESSLPTYAGRVCTSPETGIADRLLESRAETSRQELNVMKRICKNTHLPIGYKLEEVDKWLQSVVILVQPFD